MYCTFCFSCFFLCFIWGTFFCSFPQLIMCSWFRSHVTNYAVCKECLTSLSLFVRMFFMYFESLYLLVPLIDGLKKQIFLFFFTRVILMCIVHDGSNNHDSMRISNTLLSYHHDILF